MGRELHLVRGRPQLGPTYHSEADKLTVRWVIPHPLLNAFDALCQANPGKRDAVLKHFPMLARVRRMSPEYVDEELWLEGGEISRLLEELRKLRRVCHRHEFITSLDGAQTRVTWQDSDSDTYFESALDTLDEVLCEAVELGCWIRMML